MGQLVSKYPQNIHNIERVSRVIAGAFIMSLAFWGPQKIQFLMGYVPVIQGFTGHCWFYRKIGINSCNFFKEKSVSVSVNEAAKKGHDENFNI